MSVVGEDAVIRRLNNKISGLERQSKAGLYAAGLLVQRESQKRTPVDSGNLRGSAFTARLGDGTAVLIGYGAAYAPFVHENLEQKLKGQERTGGTGKGRYWDSGGPKFLERALHENESEIVATIERYAERETR